MVTDTRTPSEQQLANPLSDIHETDTHYRIEMDLPGVNEQDIDVSIDRNVLTVYARSASTEPEDMNEAWREYRSVDYQRQFTLGRGIDRDGVSATYRDGVLHLELPKAKEHQPQRIQVSSN